MSEVNQMWWLKVLNQKALHTLCSREQGPALLTPFAPHVAVTVCPDGSSEIGQFHGSKSGTQIMSPWPFLFLVTLSLLLTFLSWEWKPKGWELEEQPKSQEAATQGWGVVAIKSLSLQQWEPFVFRWRFCEAREKVLGKKTSESETRQALRSL